MLVSMIQVMTRHREESTIHHEAGDGMLLFFCESIEEPHKIVRPNVEGVP